MSTQTNSYELARISPTTLTRRLDRGVLSNYALSVSDEYGVEITADSVSQLDARGITLRAHLQTGSSGKVHTDSYEYARTLYNLLDHDTCTTGETEGYPVWFENAAWCNECRRLLDADDKYVGEVDCPTCDAEFPRGGMMRATAPAVLEFEERVTFSEPVTSVDELEDELRRVFGVDPGLTE